MLQFLRGKKGKKGKREREKERRKREREKERKREREKERKREREKEKESFKPFRRTASKKSRSLFFEDKMEITGVLSHTQSSKGTV